MKKPLFTKKEMNNFKKNWGDVRPKNKKKYTYDMWSYAADGRGRSGGTGGSSLVKIRETYNNFKKHYPNDMHLIIRRPDNKLMNFYHPFENIEGIKS